MSPAELGIEYAAERTGDNDCLHGGAFQRGVEYPDSALHRRLQEIIGNVFSANDQR